VTYKQLRQLLLDLGFAKSQVLKNNHRSFHHSGSSAVIVLPDNRDDVPARPADIAAVQDHLQWQGHLEPDVFRRFLIEGKLPAA
jgi:hypothetical protein